MTMLTTTALLGTYAAAEPEEWRIHAECRLADPELFSPDERRAGQRRRTVEKARGYCARCPVAQRCLDTAIERREKFGVWAGHDFKDPAVQARFHLDTKTRAA